MYLSGHYSEKIAYAHKRLGFILTPDTPYRLPDGVLWAADSGCYARPDAFSMDRYLTFLETRADQRTWCLFATAPDRVGDAETTLAQYGEAATALHSLGYKAALVGQDGMEHHPIPWGRMECFFVGGTTRWKLSESAYQLAAQARQRGKWLHMGRVNGFPRLKAAQAAGFDSADGTKLAFGPDTNLPIVLRWLRTLDAQPALMVPA